MKAVACFSKLPINKHKNKESLTEFFRAILWIDTYHTSYEYVRKYIFILLPVRLYSRIYYLDLS